MKKLIALTGITALLVLTGCGTSEPAEKPAEPVAQTQDAKPAETEPATETEAEDKHVAFVDIQNNLDTVFDCTWTEGTITANVTITGCPEETTIVGTGRDQDLNAWTIMVAEEVPNYYKVVGSGYTIITPTKGQANQAWDVMGADGEVLPIK